MKAPRVLLRILVSILDLVIGALPVVKLPQAQKQDLALDTAVLPSRVQLAMITCRRTIHLANEPDRHYAAVPTKMAKDTQELRVPRRDGVQ